MKLIRTILMIVFVTPLLGAQCNNSTDNKGACTYECCVDSDCNNPNLTCVDNHCSDGEGEDPGEIEPEEPTATSCVPVPTGSPNTNCEWTCGPLRGEVTGFVFRQEIGSAPNEVRFRAPDTSEDITASITAAHPHVKVVNDDDGDGFSVEVHQGGVDWPPSTSGPEIGSGEWAIGYYGGARDCDADRELLLTVQ